MKKVMKIVDVVAFVILLTGGLNYLVAGVFGVDLFRLCFGEKISVLGRIVYLVIGLAAVLLVGTIVARVVTKKKKQLKSTPTPKNI